jgi:hypothetical protein
MSRNELIDMAVREAMAELRVGPYEYEWACVHRLVWDRVLCNWPKLSRAEENAG